MNVEHVPIGDWAQAAETARDAGYGYFVFLSGIDWLPNPNLDGEKTYVVDAKPVAEPEIIIDPEIRKGGGTTRFQVFARVFDTAKHTGLTLFADLDNDLHVPTWTNVYRGADWHERETWEMYGFTFDGHPGLRHLYLPEHFEGHPLRKDFPLAARIVRPWPGLVDMEEMPTVEAEPES